MAARRPTGRRFRAAVVPLAAILAVVTAAPPASATVFTSVIAISIPGSQGADTCVDGVGAATPYPSTIGVTTTGLISDVNVTLAGLSHVFPPDMDVLLVGPGGQSVVLMADTGVNGVTGKWPATDVTATFDDSATATVPDNTFMHTGSFLPTNVVAFNGIAPAPPAPYGSAMSVFNGTDPNGTWSLFVYDDRNFCGGSIARGWSLDISTRPLQVDAVAPEAGRVGDEVTLTGLGLTGTSAVRFGAVAAPTFHVDSDTQITATVPSGASTGPVTIVNQGATVSASDAFVVAHDRHVSLLLRGRKGSGTVQAVDAFGPCATQVAVKIQRREGPGWRTVAGVLTRKDHSFHVSGLTPDRRYRAIAKGVTLPSGDVCDKAISPVTQA